MRHLQRILDALPTAQVPKTDDSSSTVPVVSPRAQKSNIVAVSVSPGISRMDSVAPLLNADWTSTSGASVGGILLYILLQPLLRIFTKTPTAAAQTVFHALFLPTPFKALSQSAAGVNTEKAKGPKGNPIDPSATEMPEEVLKPGALYADCAVVKLKVMAPAAVDEVKGGDIRKERGENKAMEEEVLDIQDDGEFGGEVMGRLVWEAFEEALKAWEKAHPTKEEAKEAAPDVDVDSDQHD